MIHINDGDTITVLNAAKEQIRIRLNGIDCPEKGQAYGKKATEFTKDFIALQMVTIETFGKDQGLWKDSQPIPPWDFRHRGGRTTLDSEPTPSPSSTLEPSSKSFDSLPVVGNLRSGKYHRFDCLSFNAVAPPNRLIFPSVQAAEAAGFEVAGNCPH